MTRPLLITHNKLLMQSHKAPHNPRSSIISQFMLVGQVWLIQRRLTPSTRSHIMQSDFHWQSISCDSIPRGGGIHIDIHCSAHTSLTDGKPTSCMRSVTWTTRHITFTLPASCLLMNVNKAVSREEMRKRERGQERREGGGRRGENTQL